MTNTCTKRNYTKNPYHNYIGFEEIRDLILEHKKSLENGTYETNEILPKGRWSSFVYNQKHCIQTSRTKDEMERGFNDFFPIEYETGEVDEYTIMEKVKKTKTGKIRNRKKYNPELKGDFWEYKGYKSKYELYTDDIQFIFEVCRDYRQVPSGIKHNLRNVVVCDFDDESFNENTIQNLKNKCKELGIPEFTYVEVHLEEKENKEDERHYQVGWVLDRPINYFGDNYEDELFYFSQRELFSILLRTLGKVFNSDLNFKGYKIHNPNWSQDTYTYWNNDNVDRDELIKSVLKIYWKSIKENEFSSEDYIDNNITDVIDQEESFITENQSMSDNSDFLTERELTSRHCYLVKKLREYLFQYRRQNGSFPNKKERMKISIDIEKKSLEYNGKREIEEEYKIRSTMESVFEWCKKEYKEIDKEKGKMGNLVKSMNRELNVLTTKSLLKKGVSKKEICEKLRVSDRSVRTYVKEDISYTKILELYNMVISFSDLRGFCSNTMKRYIKCCEDGLKLYNELSEEIKSDTKNTLEENIIIPQENRTLYNVC